MEHSQVAAEAAATPHPTAGTGTRSRRHGATLERAIFAAVWAELAEVGYAGLTMERIAARAHTSKPVLYRRWSSRAQLVVAAMAYGVPTRDDLPDTGELRSDVIALLTQLERRFDDLPADAIRGLMFEVMHDPAAAAIREHVVQSHCTDLMMIILNRAAARGEIDRSLITPRIASVPKDLVRNEYLTRPDGGRVPASVIAEIVDEVFLPLVRGR